MQNLKKMHFGTASFMPLWSLVSIVVCCYALLHTWIFYGFTRHRRRMTELARLLPGPKPFSIFGNTIRFLGNPDYLLQKLMDVMDEYSTPMRMWLGPTVVVVVDDPQDIEVILTHPKAQHKDKVYQLLELYIGKGLITSSGDYWRKHKKVISPTFHTSVLDNFIEPFSECTHILVGKLSEEVDKGTFDIMRYVHSCSLDMVCETIMGTKMNTQNGDNHDYLHAVQRVYDIATIRMFRFWLHNDWIFLKSSIGKEFSRALQVVLQFSSKVIQQKRREYTERKKEILECERFEEGNTLKRRKVFLDLMIELSDSDSILTDQELREETDTLMAAGVDTIATISCFTFLMLGIHQDCQKKVYEELENIFGDSDRPPASGDLQRMTYLDLVLKETLRLYPIGPIILRQLQDDIGIRNYTLPSGCSVALFLYRAHHSEKNFDNPEKFDPDRFLPQNAAKYHPYSFLPFSAGTRKCLGQTYATMALKVLTSTVLRKYLITTDKKMEDIRVKAEISIHAVGGYNVRIKHRNK